MKAAIYARISTNDQSPDSQLQALRDYCSSRGLEITKEYVDVGISGAVKSRPQLNALMKDARRRAFDSVVCFRFDRFARSTKHLLLALEEFRALKIAFISVSEAIDTTTPLGEALFTIVGAISQLERDIIRERVIAGLNSARAKGKVLGRPKIRDDRTILKLRNEGKTYRQIGELLSLSRGAIYRSLRNV